MLDTSREEQLRASLRKSAHVIQELKTALSAYHEPIAVIGMACRFPGGADTPEKYWQLLAQGIDAIGPLPAQRIHPASQQPSDGNAATPTLYGGFLPEVDGFDTSFFGISPREATVMDPQQRLLLEVTWEALEAAHLIPEQLVESETGVFIGIFNDDYNQILYANEAINQENMFYAMTGNYRSVAAGRIAYTFGLVGPAVAIDTACSSSLVAIHQACQSLRNNECTMALAGGSHLILYEQWATRPTKATDAMFAADGRCKTFDAAADGFGRGEGCGMVVLKRLSDAQRDGDTILALIRGTAINQDGRSSGLTAPSGPSQQRVIRRALADAGLDPNQVGYIEAHGTGTNLGDPIEIGALNAVFRQRTDPLWVGSVKTNFGHLEATAGVAGLLKVILSLQQGQIPPNLHFHTPHPYIDWQDSPVKVPTALTEWPAGQRIAGISSFGISGTNAHLVVEAAPPPAPFTDTSADDRPYHLLTLSARNEAALGSLVNHYRHFLAQTPAALGDLCYSSHVGRSHFEYRLSITAESIEAFQTTLAAYAQALPTVGLSQGCAPSHQPKAQLAFLFTGQGSQYVGMGRDLYAANAAFRTIIDRCEPILQATLGRSLLALLYPERVTAAAIATAAGANDLLESHPCGQAVNFALECALVEVWRSWGVTPDVVLGHSLGDFAAAYAAGVLTLEDGLRLVIERGRLMESAVGAMVSVLASEAQVTPYLTGYPDVTIGVINGPTSVVISGSHAGVEAVTAHLQAAGFKTKRLAIPMAAHSPLLERVLDAFEAAVRRVHLAPPTRKVVSSMTGQPVTHELTDPVYWRRHLRNTVRFADGVATLHQQGVRLFVEIGPKATLLGLAQAVVEAALAQQAEGRQPQAALFLPSLREGQNDWQRLLLTLGELYVQGVAIDWPGLDQGYQRRKVTLPTYPFQRQRYWVETREKRQSAALRPLIDKMTYSPAIKERIFETPFSVAALPFLADHRVYGEVVSPGACQLAMVLSAAELTLGQRHAIHLHDLLLPQALVLPTASDQSGERTVQVILAPVAANGSGPHYDFKVISFTGDGNEAATTTATHATGSIVTTQPPAVSKRDLVGLRQQCATPFDLGAFYQTLNEQQIDLGARFRWLQTVWHSQAPASAPQEALAQLQCPVALQTSHGDLLHPGLLDACFQVAATLSVNASASAPLLPFALATLQLHRPATGHTWWCHAVAVGERKWDIQLTDEQGEAIATLTGFEMRPAAPHLIQRKELWRNWLYAQQWEAQPQVQTPQPTGQSRALSGQPWLIFADRQGIGAALSKGLQAQGAKTTLVYADETAVEAGQQTEAGNYQLHPQQIDHYRTLLATLAAEQTPLHVVHLWSLDTPGIEQFGEPSATTHLGCRATLSLVQALLAQPTLPASFWLVTAEAQAVQPADAVSGVTQAPLWGMGKVIALEYPDLACVRIDLDRAANDPAEITVRAEWLLQEITTQPEVNGRAEEIALRAGKRYVSRLVRYPQHAPEQTLPLPDGPYALTIRERGTLDQLQLTLLTRRPPAAHEVEIKVHTTGLNFLDVLETLGVSPYKRDAMGAECAGEVVAVGAAVTEYQIGDRVVALGDGSFQQYLTVATTRVVLLPKELSFMDAATIPVNFLTAYYALQVVTQLQPGDKVLIHAASGGTGMAAVKIAQSLGAEVYGTASPAKWGALQAIGVKHLYNSRTLDFAGEILRDTNGRGVNVVLNALTSAGFIEKSLSTLAPNGKFVEIAQRDVWTADQFKTTRPDVTYHLLNLRAILQQNPQQLQSLLVELLQQIKSGSLTLLPYQAFPLEQAITAFRTMQQAKHIGKIVLVHPHQHELTILAKASYLITGGLGGLGLTVAHWLATQGARHLILLGRSQPSPAAQEQIRQLAAQGVIITIAQADVSDPAQVQRVVSQIPAAYPLRGVIHAAGVLADGALPHQEWRRFDQVLAPKVQGTWHLHEATKALPLDFFVLFSSLASLFGNRGQANHAAANAFLDAFAHYRRSQGLPALSINWGAWAEVGAAAELVRNHHTQLAAQGLGPIAPDQGVAALATLLRASATQVAVSPINWQTRLQNQPARRAFEQAFWQTTPAPQVHQTDNIAALRDQLAKADAAERRTLIEQSFRTVAARVLAAPSPQSIDLRQGLVALGLDSLMAIELRNRLKQMLAVELPVTNFLDNASMHSLIDQLDTHYAAQAATATPAPPVATALDASPSGQSGATTKKIRRTL